MMNKMKETKILKAFKLALFFSATTLPACGLLPEQGPSKGDILDKQVPYVAMTEVSSLVIDRLERQHHKQRFSQFMLKDSEVTGRVKVGDSLNIILWEADPALLFTGNHKTELPTQMVNKQGNVFIPFVGYMRVSGLSPEAIQRNIIEKFQPIANQAQAMVQVVDNKSENVTILSDGAAQLMPLTYANEKVLDAVAAIGGAKGKVSDISVQLTRGSQVKSMALETLASTPTENIALRKGDVITLLDNPLSFTALGAVGRPYTIPFSAKGLSLAEAIGKMGGLDNNVADPKGVFVFRYRPFKELSPQERQLYLAKGYRNVENVPYVYHFNLLKGDSIFTMQRFSMQNKDVVFVSNAPLAEFNKFLRMVFSTTLPTVTAIRNFD